MTMMMMIIMTMVTMIIIDDNDDYNKEVDIFVWTPRLQFQGASLSVALAFLRLRCPQLFEDDIVILILR